MVHIVLICFELTAVNENNLITLYSVNVKDIFRLFFLFSTILFAEFGVLIHQLPKSSFLLFGAGKSRISADASVRFDAWYSVRSTT